MSETAVLGALITACFALVGAIYASVTGRQRALESSAARMGERLGLVEQEAAAIKAQNARQERDVAALQAQNTAQESELATLRTSATNMSQRHEESREDLREWMRRLEAKLDRVLSPGRSNTPSPGQYRQSPGKDSSDR